MPTPANFSAVRCRAARARRGAQHQLDLIGLSGGHDRLEFLDPNLVVRATAGGIHQDKVVVGQRLEREPRFVGGRYDVHGQVDNVGVGSQLLDGGNSVGIDGDECDAFPFSQPEIGSQFGDRRRFSDARGTDDATTVRWPDVSRIGPDTRTASLMQR